MPLDAICLRALTNELKGQLLGARIDKVQQPARDQIVLLLRGNLRLLLNAGPNQPRVQLTEVLRENPAEPPMLCMLLRKHLAGGRLAGIRQPAAERMLDLTFDCTDELGVPCRKHLILELVGRNSNLILTGPDGRMLGEWTRPRVRDVSTHGTGCSLSAAIAARLAAGDGLVTAVERGLEFIAAAIRDHVRWVRPARVDALKLW